MSFSDSKTSTCSSSALDDGRLRMRAAGDKPVRPLHLKKRTGNKPIIFLNPNLTVLCVCVCVCVCVCSTSYLIIHQPSMDLLMTSILSPALMVVSSSFSAK